MNPTERDRMIGSASSSEEMKKSPKGGVTGEMMKSSLMFEKHYTVSFTVAAITLASIGLFGFGGYVLDQTAHTFPLFFIFGMLISFPASMYGIYRWVQERYVPSLKKLKK